MSVEDAVLSWLDFDYQPACGMKDCKDNGFGLVSFEQHTDCRFSGAAFYVACARHLYYVRAGKATCPHCTTPMKMKHCLSLL